ncbi:HAD-IIIA family hydrolase [Hahella aquimaris]|uniref:KdsC family phosphatase n=1 Tax=Hahella sp. HNIBRBA332 TaxID=3015983 RepID=UPI00273C156A|nr:HAD-IIIA family hydrolase [Hahella sp. HNIBRBA332]WLQ14590.1 HAD-IIIA family hydrolase [Hahella sp. HNIBRBA332]
MSPSLTEQQILALQPIKLLALDVDGVLTDGTLYFGESGEQFKPFSILDGLGVKLLQKAGVTVAIITGRKSAMVAKRASDLGILELLQGREDKLVGLNEIRDKLGLELNECAYIGDDLPDLAAIRSCGFGVTVPNGHWFVRQHAAYCTSAQGGKGAVREVSDMILAAKGLLHTSLEAYL